MYRSPIVLIGICGIFPLFVSLALAAKCPKDSVPVGNVYVDTYEASAWEIPASNTPL